MVRPPLRAPSLTIVRVANAMRARSHGLGSTYRAIGAYADAETTLRDGIRRFPNDPTFAPFLAMTLYNRGRAREAVALLLDLLLDITNDERLLAFERAIRAFGPVFGAPRRAETPLEIDPFQ